MGIFPEFGSWINQNTQQPLDKDESEKSGNVKSEINNNDEDSDEMKAQLKLWRDAEKKEPWHDAPPKVKVEVSRDQDLGICRMRVEFTIGLPPQAAFEVLTNPHNKPSTRIINGRELLKNISRKVTSERKGTWQGVDSKKAFSWNFLWWSETIPLELDFIENPNDLTVQYEKLKNTDTMKFMDVFMGIFRLYPIYIDSKHLCKQSEPKSREEYEKCSRGQGRIATKVKLSQFFKPTPFYNMPIISWYIRWITVKTTKNLIEDLQTQGARIRAA